MGNVKITYNDTQLSEEEISGDASITYNGSVIGSCAEGETKTLNCNGLYMNGNVVIGGKTLNCANNIMAGNVVVINEGTVKPYIEFSSPSYFSIVAYDGSSTGTGAKHWSGTLLYSTDASSWGIWTGATIGSTYTNGKYRLYMRGYNNYYISRNINAGGYVTFKISGSNVSCNGNLENLMDFTKVESGTHPTMNNYAFNRMFYGQTALVSAPELGSITLGTYCYYYMFYGCTNLTKAPSVLPATLATSYCYNQMFRGCTSLEVPPRIALTSVGAKRDWSRTYSLNGMFYECTSLNTLPKLYPYPVLTEYCYHSMFYGCSNIKLSTSQTGAYQYPYRIPDTGTVNDMYASVTNMFYGTGGTFTGTPSINTTYYTDHEPV